MKCLVLFILMFSPFLVHSQDSFEVILASDDDETIYKGLQHPSGSYFLTGRKGMDLHTSSPYIVKISACGDVQDMTIIREDTNGFFPTLEILNNGNLLLIGQCKLHDTLTRFDHLWLCEIDTNLNIINEKTYFMLKDDYYEYWNWYSLLDQTGNIVLAGNYIYYPGHHDLVYLKVNQNCDTVLSKSYHYQFGQVAGQIFNQPDTSYLSVVERINPSQPLSLVELDTNLTIINITPTTLEYNFFQGYTITWIDSNVSLHSASRYDYSSETRSIGVVLADSNYQIQKEVIFDRPDTVDYPAIHSSHCYIDDSTIYVLGYQSYSDFYMLTPSVIFLYLLDKDLNVLGNLDLGGDVNYKMWGVAATNDGGCLIYGTIYDNPDGIPEYDIYIRKLIREEIVITTEVREIKSTTSAIKIFPLPAQNILNVQLPCSVEESCCSIFEISGRLVYKKLFQENGNLVSLDIQNLKKGTYVMSFQFPDQREFSSKFIKN